MPKKGAFSSSTSIRNSRERSQQNEMKIVSWLYKWGFSTVKILQSLLNVSQAGAINTLERNNKVTREKTNLSSVWYAYRLTEQGVMIAEARMEENFEYQELTKEKVVTSHFVHDLYTQAITMVALKKGVCVDFFTPRMTDLTAKEGRKVPDVIWVNKANETIAVEVEINQKWEKKLDNFFGRIIESIESGSITRCVIITPSQATLRNYQKSISRKSIPIWTKKSGGLYRLETEVPVRQVVRDRISIVCVPEIDMYRTMSKLSVVGDIEVWMVERTMPGRSSLD